MKSFRVQETIWQSELGRLLPQHWTVHCSTSVDSTMDAAREFLSEAASAHPMLVLSKEQEAGRGRRGRTWSSAEGACYGTYCFAHAGEVNALSGFSLVVGLCVLQTLEKISRGRGKAFARNLFVKWPNDLVDESGAKLGGVLIELETRGGQSVALVGIGVNLDLAPRNVASAIGWREIGEASLPPIEFAAALGAPLEQAFIDFCRSGFERFRAEWSSRAWQLGKEVRVDLEGRTVSGIFREVDSDGALIVENAEGRTKVISGTLLSSQ